MAKITVNNHVYRADLLVFDKDGLMFDSEQFWIEMANARMRSISKHCSSDDLIAWTKLMGVKTEFKHGGLIEAIWVDPIGILAVAPPAEEIVILAGFLSILSEAFVRRYDERILNVHPSLIPSFCGKGFYGLKVHEAALARGVKYTGATVHFVNEIPDGGRIICQKAVEIREDDTPETLQRRVMEQAEWIILPAAAQKVARRIRQAERE
jgi:hypothetical protein